MTKPGGDAVRPFAPDSGLPVLRKGKKHDRHLSLSHAFTFKRTVPPGVRMGGSNGRSRAVWFIKEAL